MIAMNALQLKELLEAKGVSLLEAASAVRVAELEALIGVPLPVELRGIYLEFNGFAEYDEINMFRLWSIEMIVQNKSLIQSFRGGVMVPIGDFWMSAEFATVNVTGSVCAVHVWSTHKKLDDSVARFLSRVTTERIDGYMDPER